MSPGPGMGERLRLAAAQFAGRTAVSEPSTGRRLTFHELESAANAAAHLLALVGEPGARVAILAEKSIGTTVAIWGAIKAGMMFVPGSPGWSFDRVEHWMRDCEPSAVLVDDVSLAERLASLPPGATPRRVFHIEGFASEAGRYPTAPFPDPVGAEAPLYIYYTSGTTGAPKGAVVSHAAAAATVDHLVARLRLDAESRLLNTVPLYLDRSVFEIAGHVTAGAENVIAPKGLNVPRLWDLVSAREVSALSTAPIVLRALAAGAGSLLRRRRAGALRSVLFGGERSLMSALAPLVKALPDVRWLQGYGTTETVMQSLLYEFDASSRIDHDYIPLGERFPDSWAYLADESGNWLPGPGTGELVVAGRTMIEYWRQPELTQARLRALKTPDGRTRPTWFTGDMVLRDEAGTLLYRGRRDNVVKLRGERIQLEELDAAVTSLPGVMDGAAVCIETKERGSEIVGVVQCGHDDRAEPGFRTEWQNFLPEGLRPDRMIVVNQLPRGPGGKVERARLRELVG
jgi:amino acid adenylation domain-containing protein